MVLHVAWKGGEWLVGWLIDMEMGACVLETHIHIVTYLSAYVHTYVYRYQKFSREMPQSAWVVEGGVRMGKASVEEVVAEPIKEVGREVRGVVGCGGVVIWMDPWTPPRPDCSSLFSFLFQN
jgi:hypothetical protein